MSPRALFFVTPSEARGSLGACAPRDDRVGDVAPSASEGSPCGCRPKRCEGCLAIARHDRWRGRGGVRGSFEQPTGPIVRLNFSAKITGDENLSFWLLWGKKPWG
jgi:hypothetical protein